MADVRTRDEQLALLRKVLERPGMSTSELARILVRDPRTVRKWLLGKKPIPHAVLDWLGQGGPPPAGDAAAGLPREPPE